MSRWPNARLASSLKRPLRPRYYHNTARTIRDDRRQSSDRNDQVPRPRGLGLAAPSEVEYTSLIPESSLYISQARGLYESVHCRPRTAKESARCPVRLDSCCLLVSD